MNSTARLSLVQPAPSHPAPAVPARTPVRLTRRGRAVALALLLALAVLAGFAFGSGPSRASGEAGPARAHRYVVVQPGETLWAIAREAAPQVDPRVTIERVRELNGLPGAAIFAGQRLALP